VSHELDAIFGRKPEAEPEAMQFPERLEVYVTTDKKDTRFHSSWPRSWPPSSSTQTERLE